MNKENKGELTPEVERKAGDVWLSHIKQFEKLDGWFNMIPEPTRTYFAQQIDIFAGKYPASPVNVEVENKEVTLKDFVVITDHETPPEIWTRQRYDKYINDCIRVGGCPAVHLVTDFNENDSFFSPSPPVQQNNSEVEKAAEIEAEKRYPLEQDLTDKDPHILMRNEYQQTKQNAFIAGAKYADYWKERCEAAEEVIEVERTRAWFERLGERKGIVDAYKKMANLKTKGG